MKTIALTLMAAFIAIPTAMAGPANNSNLPPNTQSQIIEIKQVLTEPLAYLDPSEKTGGGFTYDEDAQRTGERFTYLDPSEKTGGGFTYDEDEQRTGERFTYLDPSEKTGGGFTYDEDEQRTSERFAS
ncbi:hypothetical protein KP803_21230 [Vibrio sp. ZSDE26]|uniref:Uncharacterized protein n=1 Tax=Vibrio amylolyticus TaxID=2847292 RepID=A0A9X1XMS1_9VIBR|nr:hypothetical protein [Vibrio amylolyticus]MCK6265787.1 hypothetical protein [Vibrio amylolyticus]